MKTLHAVVFCVLLSAGTIVTGLTCHSCFHVQFGSTMPSFVDSVVGQVLDHYQDAVCAENKIPATYKMKSQTCIETTGYTARCTVHKGSGRFQLPIEDQGKVFIFEESVTAHVRGCSYYETNEVPKDGCHKQKVPYEDNPVMKWLIERRNLTQMINFGGFEGEVCVSSSSYSAQAQTAAAARTSGVPQGHASSFALFSVFVTMVYPFNCFI